MNDFMKIGWEKSNFHDFKIRETLNYMSMYLYNLTDEKLFEQKLEAFL